MVKNEGSKTAGVMSRMDCGGQEPVVVLENGQWQVKKGVGA
jgi:hypothetical protein